MARTLITAPAVEPLTLQETKDHLRIDVATWDALISELIPVARRHAENYCQRALITQTWDLVLDCFPATIEIPLPPLQSVTSIDYTDTAGAAVLLAAARYQVDIVGAPGRIAPTFGESWPAARAEMNAVTVRFVAGYGASGGAVPAGIRQGLLMLIGHLFERRETTIVGTIISQVPQATDWLLDPYRVMKPVN